MTSPLLPLLPSGTLPPTALLLRWLEGMQREEATAALAVALPPLNGTLPEALALGGVSQLFCDGLPAMTWLGSGEAQLAVASDPTVAPGGPRHRGPLPWPEAQSADDHALLDQIDLARLEDAAACLGLGDGASWERVLAAFDREHAERLPPVIARPLAEGNRDAWNPLPFAREAVVAFAAGNRPWALRDGQGRLYATQVVEGLTGPELLSVIPLDALEVRQLSDHDEPVADCTWEVESGVLDNGTVRAELDALGQISRLCWGGVFADVTGPLVAATVDGLPLEGPAVIRVLESGPVRGRISVTRATPGGTLSVVYSLHAHEDGIRVAARWNGAGELVLHHPTAHRACRLHAAGDLGRHSLAQGPTLCEPHRGAVGGVTWASLGDGGGRGLAVIGGRPLTVAAEDGDLRVLGSPAAYALHLPRGAPSGHNLGQRALSLAVAGRSTSVEGGLAAPFRLADLNHVVPLWCRRPAGWAGEVLLVDQGSARGRVMLYPTTPPSEAWRVDASGNPLTRLRLTREGDGIELDHGPDALWMVRWR